MASGQYSLKQVEKKGCHPYHAQAILNSSYMTLSSHSDSTDHSFLASYFVYAQHVRKSNNCCAKSSNGLVNLNYSNYTHSLVGHGTHITISCLSAVGS